MATKLNWKEIWQKFDDWMDRTGDGWEGQQRAIQRIVNAAMKSKLKVK